MGPPRRSERWSFDRFATDEAPIDVGWTGVVPFRSGH
jgi:hypothetical protein